MKPDGFTEVSGVCTDPAFRGRGYAGALMRVVASAIQARGEMPFLHAYARNKGAIALYERFGFGLRREILTTRYSCGSGGSQGRSEPRNRGPGRDPSTARARGSHRAKRKARHRAFPLATHPLTPSLKRRAEI